MSLRSKTAEYLLLIVVRTGFEPVCHLWFSLPFTIAIVPPAICHSCVKSAYDHYTISALRANVCVYIPPPDYLIVFPICHLFSRIIELIERLSVHLVWCNPERNFPQKTITAVRTGFEPV
jgi:hypothetical protein